MQKVIFSFFCCIFCLLSCVSVADKPYIDTAVTQSAIGVGLGAAFTATGVGILPAVLVGSIFGPVIGHNMQINESQYLQLVDKLNSQNIKIIQQGDEIKLILTASSFFNKGSPNILSKKKRVFPMLINFINRLPASIIRVAGFSDSMGSVERNSSLAHARASMVVKELSKGDNLDTRLIVAVNGKELLPLGGGLDSELKNTEHYSNRVEITLNPLEHLEIG